MRRSDLGESKDGVRRFAAGIREVQDREIGAVNVIMAIDQEEFHRVRLAKAKATPTNFWALRFGILLSWLMITTS